MTYKTLTASARTFALCSLLFLGITSSASAGIVIGFAASTIDFFPDDVAGFRFTVGASDVSVTRLGFFDNGSDGLGEAHPVGIFNTATTNLVVSATVTAGTTATLTNGFRFVDVAPTVLTANTTYVINGYRPTAADGIAFNVVGLTVDPLVTYDTHVSANGTGGLVFTNTQVAVANNGWFGPNFEVTAVPEPSSFACLMAGVGLVLRRRKRRA